MNIKRMLAASKLLPGGGGETGVVAWLRLRKHGMQHELNSCLQGYVNSSSSCKQNAFTLLLRFVSAIWVQAALCLLQ